MTPPIPSWIREYKPPTGWTNIFHLFPSASNLYATETLFGDWNGTTLLLAKDAAPTGIFKALHDKGDPQPWRHAQRERGDVGGTRTNERLRKLVAGLQGGMLYGSSTANLTYDDPRWSRSLPGFYHNPLHDHLQRTLGWVIGSMPQLERVICLGAEAWFLTATMLGSRDASRKFAVYRDAGATITGTSQGKHLVAHAVYHPAARVSNVAMSASWKALNSRTEQPSETSVRNPAARALKIPS